VLAELGVLVVAGRPQRAGAAMGAVIFGSSVLANQFTWRYQLVQLVFFPPAAALGLTAMLRRRPATATEAAGTGEHARAGTAPPAKEPQPEAVAVSEPTFG
ncbi:MAG TPA: hypothetical protein VIM22_00430, partial [Solirubrobacteraceae bacterium]